MFGTILLPGAERPTRRAHKKSRNGCITCKERKLKCDEVKPACGNCLRRFMTIESCDYGTGAVFRKHGTVLRVASKAKQPPAVTNRAVELPPTPLPARGRDEEISDAVIVMPETLGGHMLDPFRTYPESKVEGVDFLMRYYLEKVVYKNFPWQPPSATNPTTTYYVPLVLRDEVLFHAILQVAALRLEENRKNGPQQKSMQLMHESVRLLRLRIDNYVVEQRISDQTISTVATLAAIEHEKGNMTRLRMHMKGLKQMIKIRGGLQQIRESNPMVANSVVWMFVVAIYELPYPNLDPVLPPFFPSTHNLAVISHFQDIASPPPTLDFLSLGLVQPVSDILTSVQHVSLLVPTSDSYPTASTSLVILTRLMTLLSHLLSLAPIAGVDEYSTLLSESARYSILLHIFTPWRGLPPDGTLAVNNLLHRLISFISPLLLKESSGIPYQCIDRKNNILVVWILAVGGVAAMGFPERKWFVGHLVDMANNMGINSWEDMRACMSRVVWHEALCATLHQELWREIESMTEESSLAEEDS